MNASAADLAAAAKVLGRPVTGAALRQWPISSTTSAKTYIVEERLDTKNGGTYMYCNCKGWRYQKGKGLDCAHVAQVLSNIAWEKEVHQ